MRLSLLHALWLTWQRIHMYHANNFAFLFTKYLYKSLHFNTYNIRILLVSRATGV